MHDPTEDDPTGGEEIDDDGESATRGLSEREVKALMRDFSVGRLTAAKMGYAWLASDDPVLADAAWRVCPELLRTPKATSHGKWRRGETGQGDLARASSSDSL